jgi:hypothetical protein
MPGHILSSFCRGEKRDLAGFTSDEYNPPGHEEAPEQEPYSVCQAAEGPGACPEVLSIWSIQKLCSTLNTQEGSISMTYTVFPLTWYSSNLADIGGFSCGQMLKGIFEAYAD